MRSFVCCDRLQGRSTEKRKGLDVSDIVVVVVPSNNRALLFRSLESGFMYCTRFVLRYYSRSSIGGGGIRKRRDRSHCLSQQKRGIPYPWGSRKGEGGRAATICLYALSEGGRGGGARKKRGDRLPKERRRKLLNAAARSISGVGGGRKVLRSRRRIGTREEEG